jgi:hypothetical protein
VTSTEATGFYGSRGGFGDHGVYGGHGGHGSQGTCHLQYVAVVVAFVVSSQDTGATELKLHHSLNSREKMFMFT